MKKVLMTLSAVALLAVFTACEIGSGGTMTEANKAVESTQRGLEQAVPIPQITNSTTRQAVAERAKVFDVPNKTTYVYLVSFGKVMAFYPVKGQVVSLRSYLAPVERITNSSGRPCSENTISCSGGDGYVTETPDIDGTYGENIDGIFFFTADTNAYVEWKGDYLVSDQPLSLVTPVELVRTIE